MRKTLILMFFPLFCFSQNKPCGSFSYYNQIFIEDYKKFKFDIDLRVLDRTNSLREINPEFSLRKECFDSTFVSNIRKFLNGEWDFKQIENRIRTDTIYSHNTDQIYIKSRIKVSFEKDSILFKQQFDSLYKLEIKKFIDKERNRRISNKIILAVGFLYLKELIPDLMECLKNEQKYNKETVKLSLARLGVKEFQNEFYESHKALITYKVHSYNCNKILHKKINDLEFII